MSGFFDFQSPFVQAWAGLVGISPLEEVLVQGTLSGPEGQADAVASATEQLRAAAGRLG